jgi:hypothetical protein
VEKEVQNEVQGGRDKKKKIDTAGVSGKHSIRYQQKGSRNRGFLYPV